MNQLTQTASLIASKISSVENRERKRTASAQKHFKHAIECLVKDLRLGSVIHPEYEAGIHRRSNRYSETPQYRDPEYRTVCLGAPKLLWIWKLSGRGHYFMFNLGLKDGVRHLASDNKRQIWWNTITAYSQAILLLTHVTKRTNVTEDGYGFCWLLLF